MAAGVLIVQPLLLLGFKSPHWRIPCIHCLQSFAVFGLAVVVAPSVGLLVHARCFCPVVCMGAFYCQLKPHDYLTAIALMLLFLCL